jgi:hypothetical protein
MRWWWRQQRQQRQRQVAEVRQNHWWSCQETSKWLREIRAAVGVARQRQQQRFRVWVALRREGEEMMTACPMVVVVVDRIQLPHPPCVVHPLSLSSSLRSGQAERPSTGSSNCFLFLFLFFFETKNIFIKS